MTDRVVVIAGASSDSGKAVCAALRAAGETVVAVGSDLTRLADVEAAARYECDLTDYAAVVALAERIHEEVGPVDGLIHLVGGWRPGNADGDFDWLEGRLLTTLRNTSRAFLEDLTAAVSGRLVVVSSTAVAKPTWANVNYVTLKAAVEVWVAAIASKWSKAETAAAVTLAVSALGGDGTPVGDLADAIASVWDAPASRLNGAIIALGN
jgi:NAD(P)-dependent dehydrogenase (short-subunit alcohol dehydrogenase family)